MTESQMSEWRSDLWQSKNLLIILPTSGCYNLYQLNIALNIRQTSEGALTAVHAAKIM